MRIPISLPRFLRNFYGASIAVFAVWMLFFDSNDVFTQYKARKKLRDLQAEKAYYLEKIEEVRKDREELFGNPRQIERFAREDFLMKKKTEDVYILKEEDE